MFYHIHPQNWSDVVAANAKEKKKKNFCQIVFDVTKLAEVRSASISSSSSTVCATLETFLIQLAREKCFGYVCVCI
jgi:hypothetical protein